MKTVLITGSTGQLGVVVVKHFADAGFQVVAVGGRNLEKIPEHTRIDRYSADLDNEDEVNALAERIFSSYPDIHAGIFLAGGFRPGKIASTGASELRSMIDLNFYTAYLISRKLFLQMEQRAGGGRLIFTGSKQGLHPNSATGSVAYGLSKAMLFNLSEILNTTGAPFNIRSSVIVPSTINTEANRKAMPDADRSTWVEPEQIAGVLVQLITQKEPPFVIEINAVN
jgi:NAD(P)-dependent dehydrogenase (short-subunit alcohol dehydrogenase family)